jgi:glycosyltransferase involved in cell wall biosynthesis
MNPSCAKPDFVVAAPMRTACDHFARVLDRLGRLRFLALGTRRGRPWVSAAHTRLYPVIGLVNYISARTMSRFSNFAAESFRCRLYPWFDHWVKRQLQPGDHMISSYGYCNAGFEFVRRHGGKTFLDGGNSHPDEFWTLMSEELRRWNNPGTPVARHHYERSMAMLKHVDFILSPSSFVTQSYVKHGFDPKRILGNFYPQDLSCFTPASEPRPGNRPLTVISTGRLSLRKGTPYLLEAFQLIRRRHPSARFLLTRDFEDNAWPILAKYRDLPIEWSSYLPHPQLAERLRGADVFVLPSLEEGLASTALEALACGLPVVTTPNTGAGDFIEPGKTGDVVPIRNAQAIADAILRWGDRVMAGADAPGSRFDPQRLSFERFEQTFLGQLRDLGFLG